MAPTPIARAATNLRCCNKTPDQFTIHARRKIHLRIAIATDFIYWLHNDKLHMLIIGFVKACYVAMRAVKNIDNDLTKAQCKLTDFYVVDLFYSLWMC